MSRNLCGEPAPPQHAAPPARTDIKSTGKSILNPPSGASERFPPSNILTNCDCHCRLFTSHAPSLLRYF